MMNKEEIDLACNALKSSIQRFMKKCQKRKKATTNYHLSPSEEQALQSSIKKTTHHACCVLSTLHHKRTSLSYAMTNFSKLTNDCISILSSSSSSKSCSSVVVQRILQHWFTFYLRIQDGFVLLQSGEIRHSTDSSSSSSTTSGISSRLGGEDSKRSDGYTRLYSSSRGYTGLSWDEFYDEDVGIQIRLVSLLHQLSTGRLLQHGNNIKQDKKDVMWEKLMEQYNGTLYENALEYHESTTKQLSDDFDSIRKIFVTQLNSLLLKNATSNGGGGGKGKFTLITEDKFERLCLYNGWNINTLIMERRGNDDFVVNDVGGVLPNDATALYWKNVMKIPSFSSSSKKEKNVPQKTTTVATVGGGNKSKDTQKQKRKRLVIEDSSSDEEDDNKNDIQEKEKVESTKRILGKKGTTTTDNSTKKQKCDNVASLPSSTRPNKIQLKSALLSNTKKQQTRRGTTSSEGGGKSGGLRVKIIQTNNKSTSTTATPSSSSLNEIKTQLGINPTTLQKGYEYASHQEMNCQRIGNVVDADVSMDAAVVDVRKEKNEEEEEEEEEDNIDEEDEKELYRDIESSREDVAYYQSLYKRLMNDQQHVQKNGKQKDVDDIWDAREDLRGSMMHLGNHLLSLYSLTSARRRRRHRQLQPQHDQHPSSKLQPIPLHLKEAETLFRKSVELVKEQEESHKQAAAVITGCSNEKDKEEIKTIQRTLLLLRGRALTNVGIALFEKAKFLLEGFATTSLPSASSKKRHYFSKSSNNKEEEKEEGNSDISKIQSLLHQSISMVKSAEECARAMRGQAIVTAHNNEKQKATAAQMDTILANQLETLALRWHGKALWYLGKWKDAAAIFQKAFSISSLGEDGKEKDMITTTTATTTTNDDEMIEPKIQLLIEKYYAAIDLVDTTIDAIESPFSSPCNRIRNEIIARKKQSSNKQQQQQDSLYDNNKNNCDNDDGTYIVSLSHSGYQQAAKISNSLNKMSEEVSNGQITFEDLRIQFEVGTSDELVNASKELGRWWNVEKKKREEEKRIASTRRGDGSLMNRSTSISGGGGVSSRDGQHSSSSTSSSSTQVISNTMRRGDVQSENRGAKAPTLRITLVADGSRFGRLGRRNNRSGRGGSGRRTSTAVAMDVEAQRSNSSVGKAHATNKGAIDERKSSDTSSKNAASSSFSSRNFANEFGCDGNEDNDDNVNGHIASAHNNNDNVEIVTFRKWGDDFLPQMIHEDGTTSAKSVYPACCPEMPSDLKVY